MVKISPLEGITYNQDKVNISKVIAPPYDVISPSEQENLYNASDYNIVKLILGKDQPEDNESENKYSRAAQFFTDWLDKNILAKSDKPCIYYYIQNYTDSNGESISRKGFIAGNYIETYEEGNVLPHEFTMGGPKEDRLKLMKACKANFSQIFMTYSDPDKEIDKAVNLPEKPFIDVVDDHGIRNLLYKIEEENVINKMVEIMRDKKVLIADGHHRYETSINYRDYRRQQNPDYDKNAAFNRVMAFYTNLDDENLKVYPTHRIVTKPIDKAELIENIKKYFDVVEYSFDSATREAVKEKFVSDIELFAKNKIAFGACFKDEQKYIIFKLREQRAVNEFLNAKQVPDVLKKLDLTILHKLILSDFLEFSEEDQMRQNGVMYLKKLKEAFEAIENAEAEVVFIMATPSIQLIKEVSSQGYKMPQKSTYFYPKLTSGLVINPL
ncbi:MAG TPA: DUF1015 domain-containing protein [Candidatus Gastranaerophilales bacterium]|nr:DUF1015 domain-containing protein [Candidatus Gastranaerophilales bacterium]